VHTPQCNVDAWGTMADDPAAALPDAEAAPLDAAVLAAAAGDELPEVQAESPSATSSATIEFIASVAVREADTGSILPHRVDIPRGTRRVLRHADT
jgi:hypothetical protein